MTRLGRICAALGALLAAACSGTETGNPPGQVQLGLGVTTHDSNRAEVRANGPIPPGAIGLDLVLVSWGSSELVSCGDGPRVGFEPAAVDLAEPPPPVTEPRPEREYCSYRGELTLALGASPAELAGNSIVVRGARGDSVPFTIRSAAAAAFELAPPAPTQNFEPSSLILAFDVATWFESVDLDLAELEPGATEIVVDAASNPALLADFEAALLPSLGLYADANESGRVDAEESDPIAVQP